MRRCGRAIWLIRRGKSAAVERRTGTVVDGCLRLEQRLCCCWRRGAVMVEERRMMMMNDEEDRAAVGCQQRSGEMRLMAAALLVKGKRTKMGGQRVKGFGFLICFFFLIFPLKQ